jgi:hypothetical protein
MWTTNSTVVILYLLVSLLQVAIVLIILNARMSSLLTDHHDTLSDINLFEPLCVDGDICMFCRAILNHWEDIRDIS